MTDWKPTVLTASAPSGEMTTWINPSAIEQLQREVDALKAKAAPTPEPSAELAALRARCERLAAVACRAIALRIPAWLEPQMAGVELEGARVCRLRDALLALHPGDTEEAK